MLVNAVTDALCKTPNSQKNSVALNHKKAVSSYALQGSGTMNSLH
jgi:hypothetical protein